MPLALAGGAICGFGGFTVGGGVAVEALMKNTQIKGANDVLNADYFGAIQLRVLLGRAAKDPEFAKKIEFPVRDAATIVNALRRNPRLSSTSIGLKKACAKGVVHGVSSATLHIFGIVTSAFMIPVDMYQLVKSSMKIHNKEKSNILKSLERLADELEDELLKLLKDRQYTLIEFKGCDDNQKQHVLLLAKQNEREDDETIITYENAVKTHVVLIDKVGHEKEKHFEYLSMKWDQIGLLAEIEIT